ncbi:hypothetical protein HPB51_002749 [Rhipicephalus microplus]|uniref:HTH CENPB-type domain-containing protein n=1 Tax=Rhipicephalus microplus TaxID=6941 RepID=A0A9J6EWJ1_RHIMP|nr:hypothetical protein HPB51_002749 [Rhipicephalus microplus]
MGKHLNSYTAGYKLKVVEFALEHVKRSTGRKCNADEKCVRRWCAQKNELQNTNSKKCPFRGKLCKFSELEEDLFRYVTEVRNDGYALTTKMRVKALALAHAKDIPAGTFKASAGWVPRFMKRKNLSFLRRTTLCQRVPEDYTDKVLSFHNLYTEWMASGSHKQTPTRRLKRAPLATVLSWVLSAWSSVLTDVVSQSFKVTSTSNSFDGAEDDCLWEDDAPQQAISDSKSDDSLSDDDICCNKCFSFSSWQHLVKCMLLCMDNSSQYEVSLLSAINMLARAWTRVKEETIANCFRACDYMENSGDASSCAPVEVQTNELDDGSFRAALGDVRFDEYVAVDSNVESCGPLTDSEIVQMVRPHDCIPENDDDDDDIGNEPPTEGCRCSCGESTSNVRDKRDFGVDKKICVAGGAAVWDGNPGKKCGISNALDGTENYALFEDSNKEVSDDDSE